MTSKFIYMGISDSVNRPILFNSSTENVTSDMITYSDINSKGATSFLTTTNISGNIRAAFRPEMFRRFLYSLYGTETGGSEGGVDTYTYTVSTTPYLLYMLIVDGTASGVDNSMAVEYTNCLVNSMSLETKSNDFVQSTVNWQALNYEHINDFNPPDWDDFKRYPLTQDEIEYPTVWYQTTIETKTGVASLTEVPTKSMRLNFTNNFMKQSYVCDDNQGDEFFSNGTFTTECNLTFTETNYDEIYYQLDSPTALEPVDVRIRCYKNYDSYTSYKAFEVYLPNSYIKTTTRDMQGQSEVVKSLSLTNTDATNSYFKVYNVVS